jgi:hypothetical protein
LPEGGEPTENRFTAPLAAMFDAQDGQNDPIQITFCLDFHQDIRLRNCTIFG